MSNEDETSAKPYEPTSEDWAKGFHGAYNDYSRVLRTWLVAYGIGGPVLLLNSEFLLRLIAKSGSPITIGILFLTGVALQIGIAALNKAAMWTLYFGEIKADFKERRIYKFSDWFSEQLWIDFLLDIASIALFTTATLTVFSSITKIS